MRKELDLMAAIDQYINGTLSPADKATFEKRLATDPALRRELELQQDLLQGIRRAGMKQLIRKGMKKYTLRKNLRNWGLGGMLVVALAVAASFIYGKMQHDHPLPTITYELPALNEQGESSWSDADKYLPTQLFEINADKDNVVETQGGIVLAVPAHSFLTADGIAAHRPEERAVCGCAGKRDQAGHAALQRSAHGKWKYRLGRSKANS